MKLLKEINEAADQKKRKPTAATLNKELVTALELLHFTVDSREKTEGALKTWMKGKMVLSDVAKRLKKVFKTVKFEKGDDRGIMLDTVRGDGWKIERQGKGSVFVSVYSGPKAEDYRLGMDV